MQTDQTIQELKEEIKSLKSSLKQAHKENMLLRKEAETIKRQGEDCSELIESEEKYKALYHNAPLSYQSLDENGCFIDINPMWLKTLGYERNEVIGKWYGDFLHPDYQEVFRVNFPAFKKRGYIHDVQFKLRRKDGSFIHVSFEGCIGYTPEGKFKQTYCVFKDITEQKTIEQFLSDQKKEFETIFNLVPAQIWYKDTSNGFIKVNQQVCKDIGLRCDEIEGHTAEELFPNFAKQYFEDDLEVIRSKKPKLGIKENINSANGEIRWLNTDKIPVFNNQGEAIGIIAFAHDITEKKKIEDALIKSEENFRLLVENQNDLVVKVDKNNRFVYVSPSYCKLFGKSEAELLGNKFTPLVHKEDLPQTLEKMKELEYSPYTCRLEQRAMTKDGWRWLEWVDKAIINSNGDIEYIIGVGRDINDRVVATNTLKERNEFIQTVLDNLPIGVALNKFDEGKATYMNKKFEEIYGWTANELVSISSFFEKVYPDPVYRERIIKRITSDISTGDPERMKWNDIYITRKDGSQRIVNAVNIPLLEQNTMVSTVMDVTEHTQDKEALLKSQRNYQTIFNSVNEAIFIHDAKTGNIIDVNDSMLKMYMYESREDILANLSTFWGNNKNYSRKKAQSNIKLTLENGPQTFEWLAVKKNGIEFWVEVSLQATEIGGIGRVLAVVRDISDRKNIEFNLKESEEKWRSLFEILPVGVSIVNKDNKVTDCNKTLSDILDISQEDLLQGKYAKRKYLRADSTEMLPKEFPSLRAIKEHKAIQNIEIGIVKEDGNTIWTNVSAAPLASTNSTVTVSVDITESKKKLDEIQRTKERWESLFNNSPSSIAVYESIEDGKDFIFTDFNATAQKTDQIIRDKVIGKHITELFPAAIDLGFLDIFRRVWETGKTEYMQPTLYKDGRIEGWRENIIYRLNTGEVVAIYNDITRRMTAEIKLRQSEQKFKSLFENAADPILLVDLEGNIVDANPATSNVLGYTQEEIKSLKTISLNTNEFKPKVKERLKALIKRGNLFFETAHYTKNGEVLYFEIHSKIVEFDDKKLILSVYRDITEKRKAEIAIKESESQLNVIFNNAPAIMILMNEKAEILRMNRFGL